MDPDGSEHMTTGLFRCLTAAVVAAAVLSGCARGPAAEFIGEWDTAEIVSLDPGVMKQYAQGDDVKAEFFYEWKVIGRAKLGDRAVVERLLTALDAGITEGERPMKCFDPRHALRVTRGDSTRDLVICFECRQVYFYEVSWESGKQINTHLTSRSPEPIFDEIFKAAGLPKAAATH